MRQYEDIRKYAQGDHRGKAANRLERQAMNDPFLHEALEGYREMGGDSSADIDHLRQRIARRISHPEQWLWWGTAAAVTALLVLSLWVWREQESTPAKQLALSGHTRQETASERGKGETDTPFVVPAIPPVVRNTAQSADGTSPAAQLRLDTSADSPQAFPVLLHTPTSLLPITNTLPKARQNIRTRKASRHSPAKRNGRLMANLVPDSLDHPLSDISVLTRGMHADSATEAKGQSPEPSKTDTPVFASIGMKKRKVGLRSSDSLTVTLSADPNFLGDVIMAGHQPPPEQNEQQIESPPPDSVAPDSAETHTVKCDSSKNRCEPESLQHMADISNSSNFDNNLADALAPLAPSLFSSGLQEIKVVFSFDRHGTLSAVKVQTDMPRILRFWIRKTALNAHLRNDSLHRQRCRSIIRIEKKGEIASVKCLSEVLSPKKLP